MHKILIYLHFFFAVALQPNAGHGLLILEVFYITHNDTPQSVGLLWTSDQARRRDLYLTTHNTHNRQTSVPPVRFEPTITAGERPQTHALDRTATGTSTSITYKYIILTCDVPLCYSANQYWNFDNSLYSKAPRLMAVPWQTWTVPPMRLRPNADHGLFILEISRSHKTTHRTR